MVGMMWLGLILILIVSMAAKDIWPNLIRHKKNFLRWTGLLMVLISWAGLIFLLSIPSDSKNAWIFGYSPSRIFMIAVFLFFILLTSWFSSKIWRDDHWVAGSFAFFDGLLEKPARWYSLIGFLMLTYLTGSALFWMVDDLILPRSPFYAYAVRLLPLVLWVILTSVALLFMLLVWDQDAPKSLSVFIKSLFLFFRRYPAYLFVLVAILFAACAQPIDIELVRTHLAFLIEEILEFFAGLTLLFAALCIYVQPDVSDSNGLVPPS
jgi:hypothetical protein